MDSPSGYKPDSTISDTELERQQFLQEEFYLSQWNNTGKVGGSPKRPNLDDRIHRMLSDSPTQNGSAQPVYQPDGYPYPMHHDNHPGMFYDGIYQPNHQMPPPHHHLQSPRFAPINHHGHYDEYNFASPRNFVNNSNLVDVAQQKRSRAANSQAVQVGNVLEIVPSNKIVEPVELPQKKTPTTDDIRQEAERKALAKLRRKKEREQKRIAKHAKKEKLRQEIQKYLDAGVTADQSDDENLVPLRAVNVNAIADRSIIKKSTSETKSAKKVLFKDGILPGETTSEDDGAEETENILASKQRRKKFRKKRLQELVKSQRVNGILDSGEIKIDPELEKAPPPGPPPGAPDPHLKQPHLKKITLEMFAAFPVNPDPIYYYLQKLHKAQLANGYHPHQGPPPPSRYQDRFQYYKNKPPPNVGQSPGYLQQQQQQQRNNSTPKPISGMNSVSWDV